MRELNSGSLVLLGEVVEGHATGGGDEGDAAGRLKEPPPERHLLRRRWWGWGSLDVRRKKRGVWM